jgi:hypothetical protein
MYNTASDCRVNLFLYKLFFILPRMVPRFLCRQIRRQSYVGVLISLWLFLFPVFLFAAQPKEFFLDGLKKLEQRSHKCVELRGEYVE